MKRNWQFFLFMLLFIALGDWLMALYYRAHP